MTQDELAAAAGMSRSFLSIIEHGTNGVDVIRLFRSQPRWPCRRRSWSTLGRPEIRIGRSAAWDGILRTELMEAVAMSSGAEDVGRLGRPRESLDEQARSKGAHPLQSVDELRDDDIFESDEELKAFLEDLDRSRHPSAF